MCNWIECFGYTFLNANLLDPALLLVFCRGSAKGINDYIRPGVVWKPRAAFQPTSIPHLPGSGSFDLSTWSGSSRPFICSHLLLPAPQGTQIRHLRVASIEHYGCILLGLHVSADA